MFRLHVVQADYGDSLILEYGLASAPEYALIDGGPADVYTSHLRLRWVGTS